MIAANETVDDLFVNKRDGLVCKLDLEKAYDYINWNFVDRMGFSSKWRKWMKTCITTSFVVFINEGPSNFFKATRGLR